MNEVIIDGCNVAECKYSNGLYNGIYGCINLNLNPACCKNPNCYFKQLQRKIKECENAIHNWQFSEKLYSEIKAELEQYKKSKQASYESMQAEWNKAVNELRDVKAEKQEKVLKMAEAEIEIEKLQAENDTLHITISKLKEDLSQAETSLYAWKAENEKLRKEKYQNYKNIMTDSAINLQLSNMQNEINKLYDENEKLKEKLHKHISKGYCECEFSKNLQAENEELKKELEWLKVANRKFLLDKDFLTSELRDLRIEYAKLYQLNEKLKQALEEIEEIAYTTDFDIVDIQEIVDEVLK